MGTTLPFASVVTWVDLYRPNFAPSTGLPSVSVFCTNRRFWMFVTSRRVANCRWKFFSPLGRSSLNTWTVLSVFALAMELAVVW